MPSRLGQGWCGAGAEIFGPGTTMPGPMVEPGPVWPGNI